jgi:hypothetical protein
VSSKRFNRNVRNLIAAFRGLPPEEHVSFPRREKHIGALMLAAIRKIEMTAITPEQIIQENWASIVGENIAARCRPLKILSGDVLLIHSPSATIRSELQLRKSKILENLHRHPRCEKISDIRFSGVIS